MFHEAETRLNPDQPAVYRIRLAGCLGEQWTTWLGDVTITCDACSVTHITSTVADQAALYGLLRKVRDLGLPLLAVERL